MTTEAALIERMAVAQVPIPNRRISLSNLLLQDTDEDWLSFVRRVRHADSFGLARANLDAFNDLNRWSPPDRPTNRDWLVLHGPPGSGKTLLLAALARKLLADVAERVQIIPDAELRVHFGKLTGEALERQLATVRATGRDRRIRPGSYRAVRYVVLSELVRGEKRTWNPKHATQEDVVTLGGAMRVQVLLLDELAVDPTPAEVETRLVEDLLVAREGSQLLTVMATNRTPEELTRSKSPVYGARVADRLRAARWVHMAGPSWRMA